MKKDGKTDVELFAINGKGTSAVIVDKVTTYKVWLDAWILLHLILALAHEIWDAICV